MTGFRPAGFRVSRVVFLAVATGLLAVVVAGATLLAQSRRDFNVTARKYSFTVEGASTPVIRVMQNDLVHITLSTEDIAHSFTVEDKRPDAHAKRGFNDQRISIAPVVTVARE